MAPCRRVGVIIGRGSHHRTMLPGGLVALTLGLSVGLAACGGDPREQSRDGFELRIGNLVPFTGDLAPFGKPGDRAAKLAAEVISESTRRVGVADRLQVRIVTSEDTQTTQAAAVEAATKLVRTDQVDVIMGAFASNNTIPVAQSVTIPNRVVQISPASTSPDITGIEDNSYVWRTSPSDVLQGRTLATAVAREFGRNATINTGARNDAYGTALIGEFEAAWRRNGGTIGHSVKWDPKAPTFDSEAARLVRGSPFGWVIVDFPETWAKMGPALVCTGEWNAGKTFTTDGLRDVGLPKSVGKQATEGMRGTAPTSQAAPAGAAFDKLWKSRAGVPRQTFDAVMIAFLAATAAGSADPEEIKDHLRDVSSGCTKYTFEQLDQACGTSWTARTSTTRAHPARSTSTPMAIPRRPATRWRYKLGKLTTVDSFPVKRPDR